MVSDGKLTYNFKHPLVKIILCDSLALNFFLLASDLNSLILFDTFWVNLLELGLLVGGDCSSIVGRDSHFFTGTDLLRCLANDFLIGSQGTLSSGI